MLTKELEVVRQIEVRCIKNTHSDEEQVFKLTLVSRLRSKTILYTITGTYRFVLDLLRIH